MIDRAVSWNFLACPTRSTIACEQDRASFANDPTAFIADKIDMYQLSATGSSLSLPRFAAVLRLHEDAVNHTFALANRADHPALLLTREAHAVKLNIRSLEFFGEKYSRLTPADAVVTRYKDRISRKQKSCFLVTKVDIVDGSFRSDSLADPGLAAIVSTTQVTTVTADPTALAVEEVNGIEIAAVCADFEGFPTCLRIRGVD